MLVTSNFFPELQKWQIIFVVTAVWANESETEHDSGHLVVFDWLGEPFLLGIVLINKIHLVANKIEILVETIVHNLIRGRINRNSLSRLLLNQLLLIDLFLGLDSVSLVNDLLKTSIKRHLPRLSTNLRGE